ncbi:MAG TPA: hypothetical protein VFC42_08595 [Methylomirabilota bacterium]|jgi:hypothetical protein|nr:hypothetical protein [Methylomirabilota bacterium]
MDDLLTRIRARVAAGQLPATDCTVTWYGGGSGCTCGACDQVIDSSEIGITCDYDGGSVHFHDRCYAAWRSTLT